MPDRMLPEEKKVLIEIFGMFKDSQVLWNKKHKQYAQQDVREKAYNMLLEKYRTVYKDASMKFFKRKLENFRSNHRKEYKKMIVSKARGDDPFFKPKLWYFDYFNFLQYKYANKSTSLELVTDGDDVDEDSSHKPASIVSHSMISHSDDHPHEMTEEFGDENEVYEEECYVEQESSVEEEKDVLIPRKRKLSSIFIEDGCNKHSKVSTTNNQASSGSKESKAFGRTVGLQLESLDGFQRTVAEKLISEVIFYARLNKLSSNSYFKLNADTYN